ncbi:MAG: 3-deoxy-D-manno-octulosonic acid transferase [Chitinophagales bacterium]
MPVLFYNIFLILYRSAIRISSLWNTKAKKWLTGRKNIFEKIQSEIFNAADTHSSKLIWIHCSSLGEFEQGRPVIEKIKAQGTRHRIVLTFFSPSGYEVKKNDPGADSIFYLPMDSPKNARRFMDLLNPSLVIFIKYDYWHYYLNEIKKRKIKCLLISAIFRKDQVFFKWYGGLQRKMLDCFTQIFVQNAESKRLLETIQVNHYTISGDTRFDSVIAIAKNFQTIPPVEEFIGSKKCIVAGSTWKKDEAALQKVFERLRDYDLKLIIAPHEIHETHLSQLKDLFPNSVRFSELANSQRQESKVLIIDNMGMLSRLYNLAFITYVGGGFTRDGVHNVLEAAVYGKPLVFGKNYKKYKEAIDLIEYEGAKSFTDEEDLYQIVLTLLTDESDYRQKCLASKNYVLENRGASEKILNYIEENRLLTN